MTTVCIIVIFFYKQMNGQVTPQLRNHLQVEMRIHPYKNAVLKEEKVRLPKYTELKVSNLWGRRCQKEIRSFRVLMSDMLNQQIQREEAQV